jgi:hypothetical protein
LLHGLQLLLREDRGPQDGKRYGERNVVAKRRFDVHPNEIAHRSIASAAIPEWDYLRQGNNGQGGARVYAPPHAAQTTSLPWVDEVCPISD